MLVSDAGIKTEPRTDGVRLCDRYLVVIELHQHPHAGF
jgi:hypothetical protein